MIGRLLNVEQLVEWELAGETEALGENSPPRHFAHYESHATCTVRWNMTRKWSPLTVSLPSSAQPKWISTKRNQNRLCAEWTVHVIQRSGTSTWFHIPVQENLFTASIPWISISVLYILQTLPSDLSLELLYYRLAEMSGVARDSIRNEGIRDIKYGII
jgi:hypothetical protein